MNYQETIQWLFEQFPAYHQLGQAAYNPGLKNIEELADFFGNPQQHLRFVHIGGTNGKGSTSNMLASILTESGEQTGLFTSPHLFDFTERIRVNGTRIEEQFVCDFCERVRAHQWKISPSFFEITWMMALAYFAHRNCSIVIAEVGLGGRLDATNIISPLLSIITNIGLDHTPILGDTRALIAQEKAGIIKTGVPVILGENDPETFPVFEQQAALVETRIIPLVDTVEYPKSIIGYQRGNFHIVQTACTYLQSIGFAIDQEIVQKGIVRLRHNTGFMGRMEIVAHEPFTLLDCAHNADGIRVLLESVLPAKGNVHILYGTSSDKNIDEIIPLLPQDAHYYFTEFENPRSAKKEFLEAKFQNFGKKSKFFSHSKDALQSMQDSANKGDTLLIFGSFFLIHDFFEDFFQNVLAETK
jgi:dihydrofolate synthase / folylpolyglutamate synthase